MRGGTCLGRSDVESLMVEELQAAKTRMRHSRMDKYLMHEIELMFQLSILLLR